MVPRSKPKPCAGDAKMDAPCPGPNALACCAAKGLAVALSDAKVARSGRAPSNGRQCQNAPDRPRDSARCLVKVAGMARENRFQFKPALSCPKAARSEKLEGSVRQLLRCGETQAAINRLWDTRRVSMANLPAPTLPQRCDRTSPANRRWQNPAVRTRSGLRSAPVQRAAPGRRRSACPP